MTTLTKAELENGLIESLGLDNKSAKKFVDLFFEEIMLALESNEVVKLPGFGNLVTNDKKRRPARNPRTGQAAEVSARRVVVLKSSNKLKKSIAHGETAIHRQDQNRRSEGIE